MEHYSIYVCIHVCDGVSAISYTESEHTLMAPDSQDDLSVRNVSIRMYVHTYI